MRVRLLTLLRVGLSCAFLCVCALLTLPAPVPFTLQIFGVFFALFFLGGRLGTLCVALYLALGACGLPVFSSFGSLGAFAAPAGGYLIGLLAASLFVWLWESLHKPSVLKGAFVALGLCYALGAAWYAHSTSTGPWAALVIGVFPFVVPDVIKILLAHLLAIRLKRHLN